MIGRWIPEDEAERQANEKPLEIDDQSHCRLLVAIDTGKHMRVIGRCELNGHDRELWTIESEVTLGLMRRALADLERIRMRSQPSTEGSPA